MLDWLSKNKQACR